MIFDFYLPLGAVLFGVVVLGYAVWFNMAHRTALDAHEFECTRDAAIPDHCVACGSSHATESYRVMPKIIGYGPFVPLFGKMAHRYFFRLCPACANPVRRNRRTGLAALVAGFVLLGASILGFSLVVVSNIQNPWIVVLPIVMFPLAFVFIAFGSSMHRYSPAVSIFDTGRNTVVFRFRNRVFRDHFAEMNRT